MDGFHKEPQETRKNHHMKKTMSLTALAGLVAVAAIAPTAQAGIALPDPGVVGDYRVVFVTSAKPTVTADMTSLNAWVSGLAVTSGLDTAAGSPGWFVVGATTEVGGDVFTNTGLTATGGVPVYLVDGTAFATDNADLWTIGDGKVLNINETGETGSFGTAIHTGLNEGPVTYAGKELDSGGNVGHGGNDAGYGTWYGNGDDWMGAFGNTSLFAISGVISGGGGPEPLLTTGTSYAGPGSDFIINFTGAADTTYDVESSDDQLVGFAWIGVTATSDEFGVGTATVPDAMVGSGKDFFRMAE